MIDTDILDIAAVRRRFPSLRREHNGQPIVFFDNPAGTQVPIETTRAITRYFERSNANTGGYFPTGLETDALIAEARTGAADFLSASPDEIAFGPNMTTLTYAVSHALGRTLRPGDEIVTTRLEHDANIAPWLALAERGATIRFIDLRPGDMTLDLDAAEELIGDRTRLVAVGLASNGFGTINDVRRVADIAHDRGAAVFVDAVHFGPHGPIDVAALSADILMCSAYKFFGPHLGIMFGRREVLAALPADRVRPAPEDPAEKWESGTQSHEALAGLLGSLEYLASLSGDVAGTRAERLHETMARIRRYEAGLTRCMLEGLARIPGLTLYGIAEQAMLPSRVPTFALRLAGREPADVARAMADRGINVWSGDHYAYEPHRRIGLTGTNRIGLVHYNTVGEIDRFLDALDDVARA